MDSINIGLLLPSSTIFPIGKEFENGLKQGLKSLSSENTDVTVVKEFIAGGDINLTGNACKKFFDFDEVDLVTGIVSNRAAIGLAQSFKNKATPFLISNLGGHIPYVNEFNEYIFINSMHLWRHAWTLGNFGVKQFGKKGMFIGAVYDAGYSFSQMFYEGMIAADQQAEWSFSVPPMPPAGELTDMSVVFPFLEQYQPDFIMAAFCGAETTLFLNEFIARGWHHKTKVLGLPYLLAPFAALNDDITIYTTQPFEDAHEISQANAFRHLGLQAAKSIITAVRSAVTKTDLCHALAKLNGLFNVANGQPAQSSEITIIENTIQAGEPGYVSTQLTKWQAFPLHIEAIRPLTADLGAGWFNPYLAI